MEVKVVLEKDNKLEFILKGVSTSFANLLRKYAMSSVPVLAIDEVTIYENTSAIFDEYIAHRIGLIPIITPLNVPKDVEVTFYLEASGPKVVYSGDLESKDKEIKVAKSKIPIITLENNQSLRLEGKAILSTAKKHAKFQASLTTYEIKDKDTFYFKVESFWQLSARNVVIKASEVLEEDLSLIISHLKNIK